MDDIKIEHIDGLYKFLQGECPKGVYVKHPPRLSEQKAFSAIWFLQEHLRILPDNLERCCGCGDLFDINREGGFYRDRSYCDPCYDQKTL